MSIWEHHLAYSSIYFINIVQFFLYKLIIRILRLICKIGFVTINPVELKAMKIIHSCENKFCFHFANNWLITLLLIKQANEQMRCYAPEASHTAAILSARRDMETVQHCRQYVYSIPNVHSMMNDVSTINKG